MGKRPGSPRWSPDSRWIAFDNQDEYGRSRIYIIDAAGGQQRRAFSGASKDDEALPSWSKDGKFIYFRSSRSGKSDIWRVPVAGGEPVQMTTGPGENTGALESWDGTVLFYKRGAALYALPLSGGAERLVLPAVWGWNYAPTESGIYYIQRVDAKLPWRMQIKFMDYATAESRLLNEFTAVHNFPGLTVSADRKTVVFVNGTTASTGTDLMLVDNFK